jgi:hypothetical protein
VAVTVFGVTNARHACVMTSQANLFTLDGTPLMLHVDDAVVVVVVVVVVGAVVLIGLVVVGAAVLIGLVVVGTVVLGGLVVVVVVVVVDGAVVLIGFVVLGATRRLSEEPGLVQAAVTVTVVVAEVPVWVCVDVWSLMGTKLEQKAEAFSATKIALQSPTLSRASS